MMNTKQDFDNQSTTTKLHIKLVVNDANFVVDRITVDQVGVTAWGNSAKLLLSTHNDVTSWYSTASTDVRNSDFDVPNLKIVPMVWKLEDIYDAVTTTSESEAIRLLESLGYTVTK